jgi:hypothetical protein
MTIALDPRPTTPSTGAHGVLSPAVAGIGYAMSWVVGLAVHASGPAIDAPAAVVADHYATSGGAAAVSSVLIHGVAAVALVAVTRAVHRRSAAGDGAAARSRRAAVLAAAVSGAQLAIGLLLAADVVAPVAAGGLFDALNRLDGVKLLLLAVAAVAAWQSAGGGRPRWVARLGLPLAATLAVGGVGYLLLAPGLAVAAAPALLLLLVWVAASGVAAR